MSSRRPLRYSYCVYIFNIIIYYMSICNMYWDTILLETAINRPSHFLLHYKDILFGTLKLLCLKEIKVLKVRVSSAILQKVLITYVLYFWGITVHERMISISLNTNISLYFLKDLIKVQWTQNQFKLINTTLCVRLYLLSRFDDKPLIDCSDHYSLILMAQLKYIHIICWQCVRAPY